MAKKEEENKIDSYVAMLCKGDIDGHDLARMVEEGTISKSERRKITRKHSKGEEKVRIDSFHCALCLSTLLSSYAPCSPPLHSRICDPGYLLVCLSHSLSIYLSLSICLYYCYRLKS